MKNRNRVFAALSCVAWAAMLLIIPGTSAGALQFRHDGKTMENAAAFTGSGYVKLAIIYPGLANSSKSMMLWSHDGTSSDDQHQPVGSVPVEVSGGRFTVKVGDKAQSGITNEINPAVFTKSKTPYLRVWFSDGKGEFVQIEPDRPLPFLGTADGAKEKFEIFVDSAKGDDANCGLSEDHPKKTLEGALSAVPQQTRCKTVITLAPGAYMGAQSSANTPHAVSADVSIDTTKYYDSKPGNYAVREYVNGIYMWRFATAEERRRIDGDADEHINAENKATTTSQTTQQQQINPAAAVLGILAVGAALEGMDQGTTP